MTAQSIKIDPSYWGIDQVSIDFNVEKDRNANQVDLLQTPSRSYRMVHFPSRGRSRSNMCVYAGRGIYMPISTYEPSNECIAYWYNVGLFRAEFGDGDLLDFTFDRREVQSEGHKYSDLRNHVARTGGQFHPMLFMCLSLVERDNLWKRKDEHATYNRNVEPRELVK